MSSPKILGPDIGYVDLLDHVTTDTLKKEIAEGKGFNKTPIRPSAAGGCTRELAYSLASFHKIGGPYPSELRSPATHRLLNLGHSIEYHAIRQFEALADFFEMRYKQQVLSFTYLEAKQNPKLSQWLEGSLDVVFWSDKFKGVVDFKSKKDRFSGSYKTAWDETTGKLQGMQSVTRISENAFWVENLEDFLAELHDDFFAGNFLQLNLYANSSFLKERGINHGSIIQYCKNDSRMREIRFKPSTAVYKKTVAKFQAALDAVAAGTPEAAQKDFVLGSVKCAYCPYQKLCWGDSKDAKKEFYKTLPSKQWPADTGRMGMTGEQIEEAFGAYQKLEALEQQRQDIQTQIVKAMGEAGANKVRLENGDVYEARRTQKEIYLRKSKA